MSAVQSFSCLYHRGFFCETTDWLRQHAACAAQGSTAQNGIQSKPFSLVAAALSPNNLKRLIGVLHVLQGAVLIKYLDFAALKLIFAQVMTVFLPGGHPLAA